MEQEGEEAESWGDDPSGVAVGEDALPEEQESCLIGEPWRSFHTGEGPDTSLHSLQAGEWGVWRGSHYHSSFFLVLILRSFN